MSFGELLNFMIAQTAHVAADKLLISPVVASQAIERALAAAAVDREIGDLFDQEPSQGGQAVPATTAPATGPTASGGQNSGRHARDMTPAEVGERYGVKISTLALWRQRGVGPDWRRRGYRSVIYDRRAVVKWMAENGYRQVTP